MKIFSIPYDYGRTNIFTKQNYRLNIFKKYKKKHNPASATSDRILYIFFQITIGWRANMHQPKKDHLFFFVFIFENTL